MALFGRKNAKRDNSSGVYLLLDSGGKLLGRGKRLDAPGHNNIYIRLTDGNVKPLVDAGILQVVPQDKSLSPQMARLADFRETTVALQPMRELGAEVRRNFRVPVAFDSFAYPAGGGQVPLRSVDLSCGGIAFRSRRLFSVGEIFELVVPKTSEGPLVLSTQLLRVRPEPDGENFYACKFVDMIDDEETLLREAVFAIQLSSARTRKRSEVSQ